MSRTFTRKGAALGRAKLVRSTRLAMMEQLEDRELLSVTVSPKWNTGTTAATGTTTTTGSAATGTTSTTSTITATGTNGTTATGTTGTVTTTAGTVTTTAGTISTTTTATGTTTSLIGTSLIASYTGTVNPTGNASRQAFLLALNGESGAAATAGAFTRADNKFIQAASSSNLLDIQLGNLAQTSSSNATVKSLGTTEVTDHTTMQANLSAIATNLGSPVTGTLSSADQRVFNRLSRLTGTAFDRAYTKQEVTSHNRDIRNYTREGSRTSIPSIATYTAQNIPVLQTHLSLAQSASAAARSESVSVTGTTSTTATIGNGTVSTGTTGTVTTSNGTTVTTGTATTGTISANTAAAATAGIGVSNGTGVSSGVDPKVFASAPPAGGGGAPVGPGVGLLPSTTSSSSTGSAATAASANNIPTTATIINIATNGEVTGSMTINGVSSYVVSGVLVGNRLDLVFLSTTGNSAGFLDTTVRGNGRIAGTLFMNLNGVATTSRINLTQSGTIPSTGLTGTLSTLTTTTTSGSTATTTTGTTGTTGTTTTGTTGTTGTTTTGTTGTTGTTTTGSTGTTGTMASQMFSTQPVLS